MEYNQLELAILKFLRPKLGDFLTPHEIYEGVKEENMVENLCEESDFLIALNILVREGLVKGDVNTNPVYASVDGIGEAGLKVLRKEFGPWS